MVPEVGFEPTPPVAIVICAQVATERDLAIFALSATRVAHFVSSNFITKVNERSFTTLPVFFIFYAIRENPTSKPIILRIKINCAQNRFPAKRYNLITLLRINYSNYFNYDNDVGHISIDRHES